MRADTNDIYDSKGKYERRVLTLEEWLKKPADREGIRYSRGKYWIKNPVNLKYYRKLFTIFDMKGTSYIRRNLLLAELDLICYVIQTDLKDASREDINRLVAEFRKVRSPSIMPKVLRNLKYMWKVLLPEKDQQGREDEKIVPYPVRHLEARMDKSQERMRDDKLEPQDVEKLLIFFDKEPAMQFFIYSIYEGYARPQEVLYRKIKDIERLKAPDGSDYALLWVSSHGKEGSKYLEVIHGYPYLLRLLEKHPKRDDAESYLFLNTLGHQLRVEAVNKKLKIACRELKIKKRITAYSLKRIAITHAVIRGESDQEITKKAGWTSSRQLAIYSKVTQKDITKKSLVRAGKATAGEVHLSGYQLKTQRCVFCGMENTQTDNLCQRCLRPLSRELVKQQISQQQEADRLMLELLKDQSVKELVVKVLKEKMKEKLVAEAKK